MTKNMCKKIYLIKENPIFEWEKKLDFIVAKIGCSKNPNNKNNKSCRINIMQTSNPRELISLDIIDNINEEYIKDSNFKYIFSQYYIKDSNSKEWYCIPKNKIDQVINIMRGLLTVPFDKYDEKIRKIYDKMIESKKTKRKSKKKLKRKIKTKKKTLKKVTQVDTVLSIIKRKYSDSNFHYSKDLIDYIDFKGKTPERTLNNYVNTVLGKKRGIVEAVGNGYYRLKKRIKIEKI